MHGGKNVLVSSPTGTGKTLTGFLAIINELFLKSRNDQLEDKIFCIYISPLKALANDINRNLNEPLEEIYRIAEEIELKLPRIRPAVRSGDTTQNDRQKMLRKPPHILITTPESLALALTAPKFKEKFKDVKYVIVDEIHEISSSKRGTLLSLNLERLEELSPDFIRIGLSATQAPLPTIANFLCGFEDGKPRECEIIDVNLKRGLDLQTLTPVEDLTTAAFEVANERMYDVLAKLIEEHKTTLIFTNTRSATEHVAIRLKARGVDSLEAHHSSLGKELRLNVEEKLKRGELKCVISSTSLELGIDIGSVDLVIQIGSPKSVSKGLQRIGRAGHSISRLSQGRFVVFNLDDLVECAVLTKAAYDRNIDRVNIPEMALDVLSQAVVGMSLEKTWGIDESLKLIKRSYPYRNLTMETFLSVINYLAGRIENNTIYSKIWYDESQNVFGKKRSTRMIYFMNVGTIPDDSDYRVIDVSGRHLGQLSDKFVERMSAGDIFVLGARTYAFIRTRGNRVIVRDATGLKPTIPSWTGEMLPRSYDLGRLIGEFREYMEAQNEGENTLKYLMENYHLDQNGARSIISYIKGQSKFQIPTHSRLYVEGYKDGDLYSIIFLIPLGRRVNDALSRAYAQAISNQFETNTRITVTDDGFMLTVDSSIPVRKVVKLINQENFVDYVKRSILNTAVFKERFRQCATRSLMVLKKYKGHEVSIVIQQLRSDRVLRAIENIPNFPVVVETLREIMEDMMDVPSALKYVKDVIDTESFITKEYSNEASPFSLSLILAGVSDVVLMEERAKLMKELQSRIVDRVYGTEFMDFKVKDPRIVQRYYESKVPLVADRDSFMKNSQYFPMTDLYRTRMNSPFPYVSEDRREELREYINEAIKEGKLWSVSNRGIFWVSPERYEIFKDLFARSGGINEQDERILNLCNNSTVKEIEKESEMSESEVKGIINDLENRYLIRRNTNRDTVSYVKVENIPKPEYGPEELITQVIQTMGPMTFDEISVRYPMEREKLSEILDFLVSNGTLMMDYVTPVFAKQYIVKEDLEKILSMVSTDPSMIRSGRFTSRFSNVNEYLENLGFYTDVRSVRGRVRNFNENEMPTIIHLRGRFIKHRPTVIIKEMALSLQKLRESELDKNEVKALEFLNFGSVKIDALARELSLDLKSTRQIVKELQHRILAYETNGIVTRITERYEFTRNDAMKTLLKYSGPLTTNEIMGTFWFYIKSGDLAGIDTFAGRHGIYYGSVVERPPEAIILPINDPVSAITGRLVTEGSSLNSIFFDGGKITALLGIEERPGVLWIDELSSDNSENMDALLRYIEDESNTQNQIVVFTNVPERYKDNLKRFNYDSSGNSAVRSRDRVELLYEKDLFSRSMISYGQISSDGKTTMESIGNARLGIRDVSESHCMGIRASELDSYFFSDLLFSFSGPMCTASKGTMESISLFRTIRSMNLDRTQTEILKLIMDFPRSEDEILSAAKGSHDRNVAAIRSLWDGAVICKDSGSKYRYVVEKFSLEEATQVVVESILNMIGFVDEEIYTQITCSKNLDEYGKVIKKMQKDGKCRIGITVDSMRIINLSKRFEDSKKRNRNALIISSRDLVYQVFKNHIKSTTGPGARKIIYVLNGEIRAFTIVKRNKNEITIESMEGDEKLRQDFIRSLTNSGFSVRY